LSSPFPWTKRSLLKCKEIQSCSAFTDYYN
jgi:hypothetical protein